MSGYKKWERPPKIKTEGDITTCVAVPISALEAKERTINRYINAEWLKQNLNLSFWSEINKIIDSAPSIDICFCRECKHWDSCKNTIHHNRRCIRAAEEHNLDYWTGPNDFCSWGERRINES